MIRLLGQHNGLRTRHTRAHLWATLRSTYFGLKNDFAYLGAKSWERKEENSYFDKSSPAPPNESPPQHPKKGGRTSQAKTKMEPPSEMYIIFPNQGRINPNPVLKRHRRPH